MNLIEKRKGQLKGFGIGLLIFAALLFAGGIVLTVLGTTVYSLDILMLVFGIVLIVLGLVGIGFGIFFVWMSSSVKATNGSIAEDNLGIGTANMKKCPNCGAEVEVDGTLCEKCVENLKE